MKIRHITACTLAALALMGCAQVPVSQSPSAWRFDYRAEQRADGVIRAFDDGKQAIVQFIDLERSRPMFTDQNGASLEYEIRGQYAVLPEIPPRFTVTTAAGAVTFHYQGTPPAPVPTPASDDSGVVTEPPPAPAGSVTNEEAELQRLRAQIAQARQELLEVRRQIQAARGLDVPTLRIRFSSVSHRFAPDGRTAAELLAAARKAEAVRITGHADSSGDQALNEALAWERARAAKAYLVMRGIDAGKIAIEAKGDREPVATNATPDGRSQNRRVDIAFT